MLKWHENPLELSQGSFFPPRNLLPGYSDYLRYFLQSIDCLAVEHAKPKCEYFALFGSQLIQRQINGGSQVASYGSSQWRMLVFVSLLEIE